MKKELLQCIIITIITVISSTIRSETLVISEGIKKIETKDWLRTKEIYEVDSENRLNSELDFMNENIEGLEDKVQGVNGLIQESNGKRIIRGLDDVKLIEGNEYTEGGKILRIGDIHKYNNYSISKASLYSWLDPNQTVFNENNTYNWIHNYTNGENPATEWRILRGDFTLEEEELNSLKNKEINIILGIDTPSGFEPILPFKNIVNVFVNSNMTPINYASQANRILTIDNTTQTYQTMNYTSENPMNENYCNKEYHESLSSHTDSYHVHLNTLIKDSKIVNGDIYKYINKNNSEAVNTIEMLVGQLSTSSGGISKLDVFLVERPNLEIKCIPYIKNDNNENIYLLSDEEVSLGDKVFYRIEVHNNSEHINISYPKITTEIKTTPKETFEINSKEITITRSGVTSSANNANVYIDGSKEPQNNGLEALENYIDPGSSIAIESDEISHVVNENDLIYESISLNNDLVCRYLDNKLFFNSSSVTVHAVNKEEDQNGSIKIQLNLEGEDIINNDFCIFIKNGKKRYNIKLGNEKQCTVDRLEYNRIYEINPVIPMNYELASISTSQSSNNQIILSKEEKNAEVYIKYRKKDEKWFTSKKETNINFNMK